MKVSRFIQLSIMMFLEFFIWGGWFVTLGSFMGNNLESSGAETAMAFSTQSWGAIVAPFIIGLIADRFFNAERILAVLHLMGAVLMYQMSQASGFSEFYPYILGYMIVYMPTLALVNSISFYQMKDPAKYFPYVRVFGTLGWIVAGLIISFVFKWDAAENIANGMLSNTFMMVAIASAVLGLYSFSLPKTPPQNKGGALSLSEILGLDALKLLKDRNFLVFFMSSVLICIPLAFYYQNISPFLTELKVENSTAWASLGQVSEVFFMLLLPFFFKKYGFKKTLLFGMLAWGVRYALFAFGNSGDLFFMLILGIALHGICYDFFFVSGQIYTDSKAGEKYKNAAQGLITLATYGIGMLIGFWVAGQIVDKNALADGTHTWQDVWLFPAIFAVGVLILFGLFFKNETIKYKA
ncbi:MFS transporter [Psychroflexus sp. MES1-P1E]|uniref:MFS transporter n=1 Tax=Psychroflexus sp. MES1-P1E TaxID=2058320 RepID=UPI000C7C18BC|nr:MFS transporter [Psychroflexus sp. MES1-P1E]PKG41381.1 MFS transporter [Psychroflexus sp. MES1-P1E]